MQHFRRRLVVTIGLGFIIGTALAWGFGILRPAAAVDDTEQDAAAVSGNWVDSVPENDSEGVYLSAMEYAKMIEPELGIPPVVDCGENVEIPIYVDGEKIVDNVGPHECDNHSLQVGYCNVGSSVGRYEGVTADGTPLPHVIWVSFCRNRGFGDNTGSVQLIGHNTETGATAFFEDHGRGAMRFTHTDPETNRMIGKKPGTDDPEEFNFAYITPRDTQCVQCHQSDPFIHNDFIDSAKMPGTDDPVVPFISERNRNMKFDLPYYVIGASDWDMRTIHIEGNSCLKCHRIGMKTFEEFVGDGWNPNHHMPPNDPGSLEDDLREIFDCWINGPENTPGCDWIIPPAGDALGRIVGDDYPYKADFNGPGVDNDDGLIVRPITDFDNLDEFLDNIENGPRIPLEFRDR